MTTKWRQYLHPQIHNIATKFAYLGRDLLFSFHVSYLNITVNQEGEAEQSISVKEDNHICQQPALLLLIYNKVTSKGWVSWLLFPGPSPSQWGRYGRGMWGSRPHCISSQEAERAKMLALGSYGPFHSACDPSHTSCSQPSSTASPLGKLF